MFVNEWHPFGCNEQAVACITGVLFEIRLNHLPNHRWRFAVPFNSCLATTKVIALLVDLPDSHGCEVTLTESTTNSHPNHCRLSNTAIAKQQL